MMGVWWVGLETACGWRHARRGRGKELPNILIRRTEPVVEYICKHFVLDSQTTTIAAAAASNSATARCATFPAAVKLGARMASVVVRFSPSLLSSRRTCADEGMR